MFMNYTDDERLMILEEILQVEIHGDKDIKKITSGSLNKVKKEIIGKLRERGSERSDGALTVQISKCGCSLYKDDDIWADKNYTRLIRNLL